jgi:hypothetical protein
MSNTDIIRISNVYKYCSGCILKKQIQLAHSMGQCLVALYNKHQECPCRYCLVKTMCDRKHECNKRHQFVTNILHVSRKDQP